MFPGKFYIAILLLLAMGFTGTPNPPNNNLLVFTKTEGYRHASIPEGVEMIRKIANELNFAVSHTEDAKIFADSTLKPFDAIIFLNTTGDILDDRQQAAFEKFMRQGGGFAGVHAATDTEYDWEWYGKMIGAYFKSHPRIQEATINVVDHNHPATKHLPETWIRTDEWYNFKDIQPHINILAKIDESTYKGGENGKNHPVTWYHSYEGGKVFYTAGGHTKESYHEPAFKNHIKGGIRYVTGDKNGSK